MFPLEFRISLLSNDSKQKSNRWTRKSDILPLDELLYSKIPEETSTGVLVLLIGRFTFFWPCEKRVIFSPLHRIY